MLILASKSPRRSMLLKKIGVDFATIPSRYDERHGISKDPHELAALHAGGKAREVLSRSKNRIADIVLGVDTLVYLNGEIFGKPKNKSEACRMIKKLAGHTHQVITAMCLIRVKDGKEITHTEVTDVTFDDMNDKEIESYMRTGEWKDKAGAYAIQGTAKQFVNKIKGDFENVVGLPVNVFSKLYDKLRYHGRKPVVLHCTKENL